MDVAELGVLWPIRRVEFAMEQRREGRTGLKPIAVFRFLSEDWSPWIALGAHAGATVGTQARLTSGAFADGGFAGEAAANLS